MSTERKAIFVSLDAALVTKLDKYCEKRRVSRSQAVRQILVAYMCGELVPLDDTNGLALDGKTVQRMIAGEGAPAPEPEPVEKQDPIMEALALIAASLKDRKAP